MSIILNIFLNPNVARLFWHVLYYLMSKNIYSLQIATTIHLSIHLHAIIYVKVSVVSLRPLYIYIYIEWGYPKNVLK